MFFPNQIVKHFPAPGYDAFGKLAPVPTTGGKDWRAAIVKVINRSERTTVRADSSASRGNAEEMVADVVVLIEPAALNKVNVDDVIRVAGSDYQVTLIRLRFSVLGHLDHIQVGGDAWQP